MQISPLEEYALRCAVQLVRMGAGAPLEPIAASRIAERERISVEYVSKIMHLFKKAGLVETLRGTKGGFRLKANPKTLTLRTIFDALEVRKRPAQNNTTSADFCGQFSGQDDQCAHLTECSVRPVWFVLSRYFDELLGALTLADLVQPEAVTQSRVTQLAIQKTLELTQRTPSVGVPHHV